MRTGIILDNQIYRLSRSGELKAISGTRVDDRPLETRYSAERKPYGLIMALSEVKPKAGLVLFNVEEEWVRLIPTESTTARLVGYSEATGDLVYQEASSDGTQLVRVDASQGRRVISEVNGFLRDVAKPTNVKLPHKSLYTSKFRGLSLTRLPS